MGDVKGTVTVALALSYTFYVCHLSTSSLKGSEKAQCSQALSRPKEVHTTCWF